MIGKKLSHYVIVEELGAGGMGVVYRGQDDRLNRSVAVKVLSEKFASDPDRRKRFVQEARSASAVNHPAIAQIYDVDEVDGVVFIAMEFVEGRTIRRLISDRELDVLGAVEIATQVAEGLAKAHEAGIVHRDIKSENIIVTPDGHAKILDFGLAKPFGTDSALGIDGEDPEATVARTLAATQEGMVVGTIGYMSPEQARGRSLDHRSDLFSLGIVLYEMVTGQRPFQGESALDTLHAIAFDESAPASTIRANVPMNLNRVLVRCLRKKPEDRYDSAMDLAAALRTVGREIDSGISNTQPLVARVRDGMEKLTRMTPGKWASPAVFGSVIAGLIVVAVITNRGLFWTLASFTFLGLLIYRRARNKRYRLVNSFGKRASKMDEVRMVVLRENTVTVIVEQPLAKTYVHLNSMLDRINGKLFFGQRFEMVVRENLANEELRDVLAKPGVVYVSDKVVFVTVEENVLPE